MALEISASRFLAPYFGTSLFVWTNVIGIVLLALATGYYVGGRLAERDPRAKTLFKIIAGSGALISVIPYLGRPLSRLIIDQILAVPASILSFIGSFFAVLFLFALPVAMLGAISPFLIKIAGNGRSDIGKISGTLFAIGTMGSMVGTFVPTLVLIPFLGTKLTISATGTVLLALGVLGLMGGGKIKFMAFLPFILPFSSMGRDISPDLIYETESPYQFIRVFSRDDNSRELRFNEGLGIQSLWTPNGFVGHGYWDFPAAFFKLRENFPKRVAVLGLAAGTIARTASLEYPNEDFTIDGVEIDSKVIEVARKYFELDRPKLRVWNADARTFIEQSQDKYDLIFVDAYANQLYIPFHLASREFFKSLRDHASEKGIVVMNVNAVSLKSPLLRAIANTLSEEFTFVSIIPVPDSFNFLVLGSVKQIDFNSFKKRLPNRLAPVGEAASQAILWQKQENGRILTDDKVPVELLTDALVFEFLNQQLQN